MKLLLVLLCAAAMASGRQIHLYRRTNPELVGLLSPLGKDLAAVLAEKLAPLGIDYTAVVTAVDPETAWRAVEIIATTVVDKTVTAGCGEAASIHAITGFIKHMVKNIVLEDLLHAGEEMGAMLHLEQLKPGMASMESMESNEVPLARQGGFVTGGGQIATKPYMIDLATHMKEVIDVIAAALQEKAMVFEAAIGIVPMEGMFDDIQGLITQEVFLDKPIGELFQKVAITIQKYMSPFAMGKVVCDMSAAIPQIEAGVGAIVEFLKGGFVTSVQSLALPEDIKVIIARKLRATLPEMAEVVMEMSASLEKGELVTFFTSLFKEDAEELYQMIAINKIVGRILMDGRLSQFIEQKVSEGKTAEVARLILETTAVALGDFELSPKEIEIILNRMVDLIISGRMSAAISPQAKFWMLPLMLLG